MDDNLQSKPQIVPESNDQNHLTNSDPNFPNIQQQPAPHPINYPNPNPQFPPQPQQVNTINDQPATYTSPNQYIVNATASNGGSNVTQSSGSSPGLIVLQWLTYAFWGWTILAMSILIGSVLANFIAGTNDGSFMPYAIAATLVLLPISVVCDFFYSKHEPVKKSGAASIVMVIHAVLFAIFGIGALITIVVCLVQLLTSSSASKNTQVALYSAMVITVLYAAVFLRTLNLQKIKWIHRVFPIAMIIIVGIFTVLAIIGPVSNTRATRNDSLIDSNLYDVQSKIDAYVSTNNKLPDSLSAIGLSGDSQKLITDNLVTYKPNENPPAGSSQSNNSSTYATNYYYELCVNYKKTSSSDGGSQYNSNIARNNYSSNVDSTNHPAGNYCYKLSSISNH